MRLTEIITSPRPPVPWAEGDNIPWNDPAFSRRMLTEHLTQAHDLASRKATTIAGHVAWIDQEVLGGRPARILDLGCGPGLYTTALAKLGHVCAGIDFGPASVAYAKETAERERLAALHTLGDVRTTPYGDGFDLVMMLYGELNVFKPADADAILRRCRAALKPGGKLLLEPHTYEGVKSQVAERRTWRASRGGLWSERPHLYLEESFWDEGTRAVTTRYFVVDAETAETTRYASSCQAYTPEEYVLLLERAGFVRVRLLDGLGGAAPFPAMMAILAELPG